MSSTNGQTLAITTALFILLLTVYLLSYSGAFTADDEQLLASGAQSFALTQHLAAMPLYGNARLQGEFQEVDPALSIIGSLVYLAVSATEWGSVQAMFLLTPLYTALTAVIIFLVGQRWGYSPQLAIWPALFFGLGSMAWPYAKTFFRDPLAGLFVAGAWLCFELAVQKSQSTVRWITHWIALLFVLAGGVLSKNIVIPLIPVLGLSAMIRRWPDRLSEPQRWRKQMVVLALFIVICAVLLARPQTPSLFRSSRAYLVSFAHWLTVIPHTSFWPAVFGALVSPGKGLVVFAPFTALVVLSWIVDWRRTWDRLLGPTLWLLTMVLAQSLFYDYRWTNPQWGARYLLPALPGLAIATLPGFEWAWRQSQRTASMLAAWTLGTGVLTQFPGVLIAPPAYSAIVLQKDPGAYYGLAIWDFNHSAVVGHWQLILSGHVWALAWVRLLFINPFPIALFVAGMILTVGYAAWMLQKTTSKPATGGQAIAGFAAALGICVLAPPLVLSVYRDDPAHCVNHDAFGKAVQYLNAHSSRHDLIVMRGYLDPFWYCYFNFGRPHGPWVGLPTVDGAASDAGPGDPFYRPGLDADKANITLFETAPDRFQQLWFVADTSMPRGTEGIDVESWLGHHYRLLGQQDFDSPPAVELRLFDLHSQ